MKYYIAENGQQAGPFEPNELLLHGLTVNSLVWCEGMASWTSASQVPELMALLSGQTYTPPTGNDIQLPQTPPMGDVQLPQMPPVSTPQTTAPQQPTPQGTPYGQGTVNQPYAPPQYGPSNQTSNKPSNQLMPKTWLTESILATVICSLCCGASFITLITGIIAIFNANGVKSKFNSGDYAGANKKSSSARMWMLITVGIGIAAALYSGYMLISNPELLHQIKEGSGINNLYPFLR